MRIEGWEKILESHIQESASKPFAWGEFDCLTFVSDAVRAMTGIDPMSRKLPDDPETIRGAYQNETEAKALIKDIRGTSANIMDVHFERIAPAFASKGDVALKGEMFGLVGGRGIVFFKSKSMLLTKPVASMDVTWRMS